MTDLGRTIRMGGLLIMVLLCLTCAQNLDPDPENDPPKITVAPFDHKVPYNSRIRFYCEASGHPAPTVTWIKGDRVLNDRRNRYISKMDYSSALTLESVNEKHGGIYQCVAENGIGSRAVANATLSIYQSGEALPEGFPLVSEITNNSITLIERGFPMTLRCTIIGDPQPQVIWYKNKAPVDVHSSSRVVIASRPGVTGSNDLRVIASESEDQGDYVCMGRNIHGTVYSTELKVYVKVRRYAPRFTIRPDVLYNVMAGGKLNVTCVAVGSPMPYVKWVKDGDRIGEPSNSPIGKNVLQLTDIRESTNYTCYAQSALGTIFVKTQVKVQALPDAPVTAWVDDITSLSAKIQWVSSPETAGPVSNADVPQYLIQFRQIFNGEGTTEEWSEQGEGTIGINLEYTLTGLQPFTIYEAAVVPYTEYGRGTPSSAIQFKTEEDAPESAPYDVKAKAVSETTALVQWKAPMQPNGEIEGYRVFYCLAANSDQPMETWSLYPTTNTLAVLNNLIRDAEYSVAVQARNRIGTGPSSSPIQFTVTPGVPLAPMNFQVTDKTSRSLTLAWHRPTGTESILSYEIYINNSRNRQGQENEGEVRSVVPPHEEYVLEDLFPNTIYNIKVTARSLRGEGPHSTIIQVKTEEAEPSAPPLNIQAEAPKPDASTQLRVNWEPPPSIQANGEITGYAIYYITDLSRDDSTANIQQITDPAQTSITIDGLEVWTKYRIWMKASTSVGDSPASVAIVARTGEDVPEAPKNFNVHVINSTAVLLQWRKPSAREAKGEIRGYQLFQSEVGPSGVRIGDPKIINLVNGTVVNHTISGLNYSSKYVFQIRAFTVAGDGPASKPKTIVTFGAVPTAPQTMQLVIVDQEPPRVRVTWEGPVETHGELRSYRLMWGKRQDDVLTNTASISSTRKSYIAEKMMKGTEYEFQLQAQNEENYGEAAVDHIRTEDGVPSGSPQNITATYRSDSSAIVTWRELDPALRNGIITMYQVRIQDERDAIDLRAENTSETSIMLEDLKPGSRYLIQVVAYTSAGAGPTSYRALYNTKSRPPAPLAVTARRVNSTTIQVNWQAPARAVVRGYKIHYSTQDLGTGVSDWEEVVSNQPTPNYLLTGLDPLSAYVIRVQAVNSMGEDGLLSEEAIVNEVIPVDAKVRGLTGIADTSTAILLTWSPPYKDGAEDYMIRYVGLARKSGKVHEGNPLGFPAGPYEKRIDGLKPNYNYTFEVLVKYSGENSYIGKSKCSVTTKAIETPRLKAEDMAIIALSRDENNFDEIYIIVAFNSEIRSPEEINLSELQVPRRKRAAEEGAYIAGKFSGDEAPNDFTIGDGKEYGEYVNKELAPDSEYKAFVRVVVAGDEFSSSYSRPFTATGPVVTNPVIESEPENKKVALILGPIGSGVVIIVIIVIIVVVIRRNKTHKKEKAPEPTKVVIDQPPVYPNDPVELRRMQFSTPGMQNHPPIPVLQLSGHIDQLRAHDNLKFSQEYESIEPGQQFTWDNSNLEYNKPKNRYANVIAYDHSRVVLQPLDGTVGSDYINANYMDGYRKQNAYISTQGPLPETFGDFWRMVWEQRSATIVMMTKLEERARVKCDAYWPPEGTEMYGPIVVTVTDCMELATYTVRTFQIEREGWAEKREVRQFQFTAWPDHGVPDYPTPLLIFMKRVKAATPSDSGPMVVHCSAGVGRTGAFIVIDAMLERIKHEKTVDIYGHVTCLRAQRNYMVQTEDQYIFIHDALLEAVLSGNTEIPARNLYSHIQKLAQPDGATTGMEKEFRTLSNAKINPSRFASANLAVNKFKNRLVNVLPYETNRVCLLPIRGVDGSDYINASFVDGYRFKKAYIATQGPLAETAEDFWRMIWEHNSTIVVMLTKTREMGREKCHQYWPEARSARYQYFVVDPHAEYSMSEYTLREFKVTDARDGQSRTIRLFHFNEWPEQGHPKSGMSFIQFIGQVHKTKEQFGQEGPITVHCSAGVGRTGVFISLSIILERMRYEGVVDMFQTVKMLRTQRQGMVQTVEQYAFCYQAALEHLASFDHY